MSLTNVQCRNDLLSKLGIETIADASDLALQDVAVAMSAAMQVLQTAGEDFFTREELTLTLAAGTALYNISANVQAIIGPVLWNGTKPLRALDGLGEIDQFARIFLGQSAYGVGDDGDPIAYNVTFRKSGSTGDICAVTIQLAPAPAAPAGTLVLDVINGAVSYVVADLDDTTVIPVAQNYAESVFLPIARMLVTRSSQFSRPDLLPQLTEDYQRAMQRLGLAGGFPNVEQPSPPRRVKS